VGSPYEPPEHPEIHLDTATLTAEQAAERIVETLERAGILGGPGTRGEV
jgi:adenylylsulfate kinase-like enzyme